MLNSNFGIIHRRDNISQNLLILRMIVVFLNKLSRMMSVANVLLLFQVNHYVFDYLYIQLCNFFFYIWRFLSCLLLVKIIIQRIGVLFNQFVNFSHMPGIFLKRRVEIENFHAVDQLHEIFVKPHIAFISTWLVQFKNFRQIDLLWSHSLFKCERQ